MTFQVEFWQFVSLMIGFMGACAAGGKLLLAQSQKHLDERFATLDATRRSNHEQLTKRLDGIEQSGRDEAQQWQRVERELLTLKADLPVYYVRREDYVQAIATIMSKLDSMALRFENILLRGEKRDPR